MIRDQEFYRRVILHCNVQCLLGHQEVIPFVGKLIFQTPSFLLPNLQAAKQVTPRDQSVWSQNHRNRDWQVLEGTSVDHLVQPPCQSRFT